MPFLLSPLEPITHVYSVTVAEGCGAGNVMVQASAANPVIIVTASAIPQELVITVRAREKTIMAADVSPVRDWAKSEKNVVSAKAVEERESVDTVMDMAGRSVVVNIRDTVGNSADRK